MLANGGPSYTNFTYHFRIIEEKLVGYTSVVAWADPSQQDPIYKGILSLPEGTSNIFLEFAKIDENDNEEILMFCNKYGHITRSNKCSNVTILGIKSWESLSIVKTEIVLMRHLLRALDYLIKGENELASEEAGTILQTLKSTGHN